ncbi:MAG TPA: type II CAAX endopeptidase family protein [Puia sp.]|jgi:membrane protease YdiL (CAAX protease family)|nr:type II CAAX endopeptidase family protein [Puia sp.]
MSIRSLIHRYPATAYFVLAYGISCAGALLATAHKLFRGAPLQRMDGLIMFPILLLGPSLASIILTGAMEGRPGLRNLLSRIGRWRVGISWWAAALLIPPAMVLFVLFLLSHLVSPDFTPNHFMIGFLFGILAGFLEEIGWTGYAFPTLRLKFNPLPAAIILGLIWGLWHFPVIDFLGAASPHGSLLPSFFIAFITAMMAIRVLICWIYSHTGSILLAMLMHASSTGCLAALSPPHVSPVQETTWYLVYAAGLWILVAIIAGRSGLSRLPGADSPAY